MPWRSIFLRLTELGAELEERVVAAEEAIGFGLAAIALLAVPFFTYSVGITRPAHVSGPIVALSAALLSTVVANIPFTAAMLPALSSHRIAKPPGSMPTRWLLK